MPNRRGRRTAGWARRSAIVAAVVAVVAGVLPESPAPAVTLAGPVTVTQAFAGPIAGAVAIAWARAPDGGSPITTYGFSMSVNGGTTWSAVHSFASKNLVERSSIVPSLACTNINPGSQGCLYRIYAANVLGFGPPSKPVALWAAPGTPLALRAVADSDFNTAALTWRVPVSNGGFTITGFDVLGSMDGAASQILTTVSRPSATVPCTAKRTCAYSVRAINSRGKSPASTTATVVPAPRMVQAAALENSGSDAANGQSVLTLSWRPPFIGGLPPDHYDVEACALAVGDTTSCSPSSTAWSGVTQVFPTSGVALTASATCQATSATCLMRVRAVNARGGAGPWRAIDLEPWAPFAVTVTPGPARGSVTVHFRGPAEAGRSGPGTRHYRVLVCDTGCDATAKWRTVSDAVPWPPQPPAPYLAGWFSCRAVPRTAPSTPRHCRVRMQFVDGLGNEGILSGAAVGDEHP
jgi:hypothetical protein